MPDDLETLMRHPEGLRRLAIGLCPDPHQADDLLQEMWLTATRRDRDRVGNLAAWLRGILRNLWKSERRAEVSRRRRERVQARGEAIEGVPALDRREVRAGICEQVLKLEEPYRETILLHFFADLSVSEIASRQGLPTSTVQTRIRRAKNTLRARLEIKRQEWLAAFPLPSSEAHRSSLTSGGAFPTSKSVLTGGALMSAKSVLACSAVVVIACVLGGIAANPTGSSSAEEAPVDLPERAARELESVRRLQDDLMRSDERIRELTVALESLEEENARLRDELTTLRAEREQTSGESPAQAAPVELALLDRGDYPFLTVDDLTPEEREEFADSLDDGLFMLQEVERKGSLRHYLLIFDFPPETELEIDMKERLAALEYDRRVQQRRIVSTLIANGECVYFTDGKEWNAYVKEYDRRFLEREGRLHQGWCVVSAEPHPRAAIVDMELVHGNPVMVEIEERKRRLQKILGKRTRYQVKEHPRGE